MPGAPGRAFIVSCSGDFVVCSCPEVDLAMITAPVRVITIEREYGSRGGEFAHDLAERLGWRLLDSELLTAAARTACVPEEMAARFDDRLDPWYYRYGKVFWQDQLYSTATLPD